MRNESGRRVQNGRVVPRASMALAAAVTASAVVVPLAFTVVDSLPAEV